MLPLPRLVRTQQTLAEYHESMRVENALRRTPDMDSMFRHAGNTQTAYAYSRMFRDPPNSTR